jgi:tetratricopeptide (TPR) repeat protein
MTRSFLSALVLATAGALFGASAFAMGDPPKPDDKDKDKKVQEARDAIQAGQWLRAEGLLRAALAQDPLHAESHNLYAYSIRKGPEPRMDLVFRHYNEALRLRPDHRGAHEYLGEAYLMTGNLSKAREHLALLDRLCAGGCEEQAKLKQAIDTAERQQAAK